MALFPERGPIPEIEVRPDQFPDIPVEVENKQNPVTPTPTQFTAQVKSDQGQPLISTPNNSGVKITIPAAPAVLKEVAKGSIDETKTWSALYWIRMMGKAIMNGWQVIFGEKDATN